MMKINVVWSRKVIKLTNKTDDTINVSSKGTINSEKYQGDAREIINEIRKVDQQFVVANYEQDRIHTPLLMLQVILLSKKQLNIKGKCEELPITVVEKYKTSPYHQTILMDDYSSWKNIKIIVYELKKSQLQLS